MNTGFVRESMAGTLRTNPAKIVVYPRARSHRFDATITAVAADLRDNVALVVGNGTGLTGRPGVMVIRAPQGPTATVTLTYYDGDGTLTARVAIRRESHPDGSITIVRTGGGFTGGTGRYRGVRTKKGGTFTGERDSSGAIIFRLSGRLTY